MVQTEVTDKTITLRMRFACWIIKATDARSEYAILLAFPWQQLFRNTCIASRVTFPYI
jgi:hypothetical protein